jgi:C-terminal processing protease CtpA/Prc
MLFVLCASPAGAQSVALANPGFEEGAAGEAPPGWTFESRAASVASSMGSASAGAQSAVIAHVADAGPGLDSFGLLSQSVDATALRGRRMRLSAVVRPEDGGAAELQLVVHGETGGPLAAYAASVPDAPAATSERRGAGAEPHAAAWSAVELLVRIPAEAHALDLGLMLRGGGAVRFDEVRLVDLGPADEGDVPARPLTETGLQNLTALARLYGYVRYFHPSDEAAEADWSVLALTGVERVEGAESPEALRDALLAVFAPVAPSLQIALGEAAPPPAPSFPEGAELIAWKRQGLDLQPSYVFKSERAETPDELPDPARLELPRDLTAFVPLRLPRSAEGRTLPAATAPPPTSAKPEGFAPSGDDRTSRLASVMVAWNALQHFYPYWDVVDADWPAELPIALGDAATDPDAASFTRTLERMVAASDDGHATVASPESASGSLPLLMAWVDGAVVVTAVRGEVGVSVGDVVTAIDGRRIEEALAETEARTAAATPGYLRVKALRALSMGSIGDTRRLTLSRADGVREEAVVTLEPIDPHLAEARPDVVAELETGVVYVDLARLDTERLRADLARLVEARALVLDMRGYPIDPPAVRRLLSHLAEVPVRSAQLSVPTYRLPDQVGVTFERQQWTLAPRRPILEAERVVLLTDARAISAAEDLSAVIEGHHMAEIVGAPTAGTNGNIDRIRLPTGHQVVWTGLQVRKRGGLQHHGVGVLPTIPAEPTLAGIRAGRDEVLEAGLVAARPRRR